MHRSSCRFSSGRIRAAHRAWSCYTARPTARTRADRHLAHARSLIRRGPCTCTPIYVVEAAHTSLISNIKEVYDRVSVMDERWALGVSRERGPWRVRSVRRHRGELHKGESKVSRVLKTSRPMTQGVSHVGVAHCAVIIKC